MRSDAALGSDVEHDRRAPFPERFEPPKGPDEEKSQPVRCQSRPWRSERSGRRVSSASPWASSSGTSWSGVPPLPSCRG